MPSSSAERLEEGGGGDASDGNSGDSGSGGSGSGGNSGRGEGQGEDGESSKQKKIITSQKITLAYALLIASKLPYLVCMLLLSSPDFL